MVPGGGSATVGLVAESGKAGGDRPTFGGKPLAQSEETLLRPQDNQGRAGLRCPSRCGQAGSGLLESQKGINRRSARGDIFRRVDEDPRCGGSVRSP